MAKPRTLELGEIPFDEKEILRYALMPSTAPAPDELPLEECLKAARSAVRCRAVWQRYPLEWGGDELDLGFAKTASRHLRRHLEGEDVHDPVRSFKIIVDHNLVLLRESGDAPNLIFLPDIDHHMIRIT